MPLAERASAAWSRAAPLRSWVAEHQPWSVLGPLLAIQWLVLLAFALTVRHNSWLYYQGGDQTYYWTDAWLFSHWRLPTAEVGWGWSYLLAPIAGPAGDNVLVGLPVIVVLNTVLLVPVALFSVYGIATRIAGRLFGYWTAVVWIAVPFVAIPLWVERYHGRYVEQTLPQTFGMTPLADFPSMVLLLVGTYLIIRALDTRGWREAVLAGAVVGFAFCVKPSNAIFFLPVGLAFLTAQRWRQLGLAAAAIVPGLVLTALWKQRGLGQLPILGAGTNSGGGVLAAVGIQLPPVPLGSISRYIHLIDWGQLQRNRDALREFFWAVRPLQFVPIAGLLAIGRRSWPKSILIASWFLVFFAVKGASEHSRVEDASFFRLMMPSLPAFVLLLAAIPLLVPKLADRLGATVPSAPGHHRRLDRALVVSGFVLVLVPLILLATARAQAGPTTVKNDEQSTSIPVSGDFHLAARSTGNGIVLTWAAPDHVSVGVYYAVLRARPRYPDPTNPEDRTVVEGVACRPRIGSASQDCHLYMRQVEQTRALRAVDRPPGGRWTYRVAVGANWLNDPTRGDLLLVSPPVTVTVGKPS